MKATKQCFPVVLFVFRYFTETNLDIFSGGGGVRGGGGGRFSRSESVKMFTNA